MKNFAQLRMMRIGRTLTLLVGVAASAWAGSTINSLSGQVGVAAMPGSLVPGEDQSDLKAMLFMELTNLSFAANFSVDASQAGVYNSVASVTTGVIAAGTVISDTYFHSDPVASTGTRFAGSITFSGIILGIIAETSTLDTADAVLGVPGVAYAEDDPSRGLELSGPQDQFTISPDLHTLTFSVMTWANEDDMRIITAGGPTEISTAQVAPEPGTLVLLPLALAGLALRQRFLAR